MDARFALSDSDLSCFWKDAARQRREGGAGYFLCSEREYNSLDKPTVMRPQTKHPIASVPSFPHGSRASDDGAVCCLVSLWITIKQGLTPPTPQSQRSFCMQIGSFAWGVCDFYRRNYPTTPPQRNWAVSYFWNSPMGGRASLAWESGGRVEEMCCRCQGSTPAGDPQKAAATQITTGYNNQ